MKRAAIQHPTLTDCCLSHESANLTPLSPAAGMGSLNAPLGIAIDASGNIWTTNPEDNSVSETVGLASPAPMPLAARAGP